MSAYSEYNPLTKIELPNMVAIEPKGLIVVVGPNSAGKTHFLNDVRKFLLTGANGPFVVCKVITAQAPRDPQAFFNDLVQLRYLTNTQGDQYQLNLPSLEFQIGVEQPQQQTYQQFNLKNYESAAKAVSSERGANDQAFFPMVGRVLANYLSIPIRLSTTKPAVKETQPNALTPIHALKSFGKAQRKLAEETGRVFGNAVFLDPSSDNSRYLLRVSGLQSVPDVFDVNDALTVKNYREIGDEGDGYRSYVTICMALILGTRPVCLIDEPEMCLHPPQAYEIGKFIGENAVHSNHVTFVATHSSHVLRGILATAQDPKIVRLTNDRNSFTAHFVSTTELKEVMQHPKVRAEAILDGIFSQGVCVVESDGDRVVYQAALEGVDHVFKKVDLHFVPVYGNDFVPPCRFFQRLKIPFAVIGDLDVITNEGQAAPVLDCLTDNLEAKKDILGLITKLSVELQKLGPVISPTEVKAKLKELSEMDLKWEEADGPVTDGKTSDDIMVKRELERLVKAIKRLRRLKEGGIEAYKDLQQVFSLLTSITEKCAATGLFVVPTGELEGWAKHLMTDVEESSKPERALIAAERIKQAESKQGDVWAFMESVLKFLNPKG